jgi:hypothetical protein
MTIVVAVAAPDGIVLAGDSRTNHLEGQHHRVASDSAQKIFSISSRVGLATYGIASLSGKTISGLIDEFITTLGEPPPTTAAEIAVALATFGDERFDEAFPEVDRDAFAREGFPLGFIVAGYDSDGTGRVREVKVPGGGVEDNVAGDREMSTAEAGILWRGETDVIRRLIKGVDWNVLHAAKISIPVEVRDQLDELEYELLLPITLDDAIEFSSFLVRVTIEMQRFTDGTGLSPGSLPTCGGPIRVLAIGRGGTEWIGEAPRGAVVSSS